ncbi:carbohydrate-binding domain-containing protein [Prevotella sp. E2-28]|uniref:carbohydrate-binding domain-containing protein n=1 Tax=Prevotella sp. E2-28 TaxID=2913620 RepID=UPI001EDA6C86|nr:carbohydrate-binding domain-containing protein [Prevotella sp. E2-28]UKK54736.1 carbohydrate-binding domain-containing protein [Prevotella sp. E2-28]
MIKKSFLSILLLGLTFGMMVSCGDDDTNSFDNYKTVTDDEDNDDNDKGDSTIVVRDSIAVAITWDGTSVSLTGDVDSIAYTASGADVVITSNTDRFLELTLSGSTTDGSLLVNSLKKYGIILNGVSITNPDGPAINNQCGKSLFVTLVDGTENKLVDGETYAESAIDQKGTLFSEGQIYFEGTGSLSIVGNAKNGIASDDYIIVNGGNITIDVEDTGSNGIKVNDGFTINEGSLNISVAADGARGIKSDARTTIAGGSITITTSGDCVTETVDGVEDASSAAGIKCDSLFLMTAGTLNITSKGDGGKGINCSDTIKFCGGTLYAETKGGNDEGKPKAVKGDKGIIVSGGSFTAKCVKSWAIDNGVDTENVQERITIIGTPTTKTLQKRNVVIKYE